MICMSTAKITAGSRLRRQIILYNFIYTNLLDKDRIIDGHLPVNPGSMIYWPARASAIPSYALFLTSLPEPWALNHGVP
jgi:hypothetical protein